MSKNWSSYENDRLIMESWRKHLAEEPEKVEEIFGLGKAKEDKWAAIAAGEAPGGGQEEYPATEFTTLFKILSDLNQRLGGKHDAAKIQDELKKIIIAQEFVIKEQGAIELGRQLVLDLKNAPTLAALMRDAAASKYAKQVQAAFVSAGFNPSTVQAAAGAAPSAQPPTAAPPTTPAPDTAPVPEPTTAAPPTPVPAPGEEAEVPAPGEEAEVPVDPRKKAEPGAAEAPTGPPAAAHHFHPGTGEPLTDKGKELCAKDPACAEKWGKKGEEAPTGPPAQASTREMAMVASQLTPKGKMIMSGELAKTFSKPPHNLSPEEIKAVQGILAQWLEPMGLELMENLLRLLKRRLIEQTVGQVASTPTAQTPRTDRTKVAPAAEDPKLQPLDLAQIYNVIKDPNKAMQVAGFIANKFRPAGVRVVNYQPPPTAELPPTEPEEPWETMGALGDGDEKKKDGKPRPVQGGEGDEEKGVLDKMSDLGDKLTGMAGQGMDSAKEAADALSQGLDSEAVHKLELALDATMMLGLTGYGEAVATPAAMAALAIDLGQGDWDSALLNAIALIPVAGKAAKAGSLASKSAKLSKGLTQAAKLADKAAPLVKLAKGKNIKKGLEGAAKMGALLKDNYDLDVDQWAETFDKVDSTLEKLAALPVVGEDIQAKLDEFKPQIDMVRKVMTTAKGLSAGELPSEEGKEGEEKTSADSALDVPEFQPQQEHMIYERWQKIAGINKKVL